MSWYMVRTGEQLAWAAGLFEGEGWIVVRPKRTRGELRHRAQLGLQSADVDVVRHFASVVGVGNVGGPYGHEGYKPSWLWQTASFEYVQATIAMLWPWLGERRRGRAKEVLRLASQFPCGCDACMLDDDGGDK
jgi:hypothetical protein